MSKSKSITNNFVWSSILAIAGYVFPLITFPYVTRVLNPDGFGYTQFADSVVQYFSILALLGINSIGIREIARVRNNRVKMSIVYNSLLTLNLIATIAVIFILLTLSFVFPSFASHQDLLFIGSARILCGTLVVEWFYKGIEEFRYITIRALLVRSIYVILVFIFVRQEDDYIIYFILTTLIAVVNAIINICYSTKYVNYSLSHLNLRPYIIPFVTLGAFQVLTAVYTYLNTIYLGVVSDDTQVGYFSIATKIHHIILSLYTAFTSVMLPRMSALSLEYDKDKFFDMINRSCAVLFVFSFPLMILLYIFAPEIIGLLAGQAYGSSIPCLRIIIPLIFVIGYEQILVIQILVPLRKDSAILINSSIGAMVCVFSNLLFVKSLLSQGTSMVWLLSEVSVMLSAQFFVKRFTAFSFPFKLFIESFIVAVPAFLFVYCLSLINFDKYVNFVLASTLIVIYYYFVYKYILKNSIINELICSFINKIHHV